jgi:glycosyltransferase involved in cell wall biosynthesis
VAATECPSPANISVVVASLVGPPFIDNCLASLEEQARAVGAEVIVVACGDDAYAQRLRQQFPWVHVVHQPAREGVPELRGRGVQAAKGDVIAIIEEHCTAAPNWLRTIQAFRPCEAHGVIGGPVVDHAYSRLRDWVVYFCEYNGAMPPAPDGPVFELNGANIAYTRQLLIDHRDLLAKGYWEAALHPVLLAEGVKFVSVPGMMVHHRGPFQFGYYLRQRYWFSRAFAGARARKLPAWRRLAYLVAAPLVPPLLLARMAQRVWRKRCHVGKFAMALPLFVPALTSLVAGEWIGYLLGPGDALAKVE